MRVFRKSRGQGRLDPTYTGEYRLPGMPCSKRIALGVTDQAAAMTKLRAIVRDLELEATGLIAPSSVRKAAQVPLVDHLEKYLATKLTIGRNPKHVANTRNYILSVARACRWRYLNDVTAESYEDWRNKQTISGCTLNKYLCGFSSFMKWAWRRQLILANPLAIVEPVDTRREIKKRQRRALSEAEVKRLIAVGGEYRGLIYAMAFYTGLRRNELKQLLWEDVRLRDGQGFLHLRSAITKNKQRADIALHDSLIPHLRELRQQQGADLHDKVFPTFPKYQTIRKDWQAAGIVWLKADGSCADFHSLRKGLCTSLFLHGATVYQAKEIMRHQDARLTTEIYADSTMMPKRDLIERIPSLFQDGGVIGGDTTVLSRHSEAEHDPNGTNSEKPDNVLGNKELELETKENKNGGRSRTRIYYLSSFL